MQAKLRNFRAIERADIELEGVTIVTGPNAEGKSSICMGIGSALTGRAVAWDDVLKRHADELVRDGADTGSISVSGEDFDITIVYPRAEVTSSGNPPTCSPFAAGFLSLPTMDTADRLKALRNYIRVEPTHGDLKEAFDDAQLAESTLAAVWKRIEDQGWDATLRSITDKAPVLKGQWKETTGETWGSSKGASWRPQALDDTADPDDLAAAYEAAEAAYVKAAGAVHLAAEEKERLEALAGERDKRAAAVESAVEKSEQTKAANDEALAALRAVPVLEADAIVQPCPHCAQDITITVEAKENDQGRTFERTYKLEHGPEIGAEERRNLKRTRTVAQQTADAAAHGLAEAETARTEAEASLKEAADAADTLAKATDQQEDVATLLEERDVARDRMEARRRWERATTLHKTIMTNLALQGILGASGVRAKVMAAKLAQFNEERLLPLCRATAGSTGTPWPDVTIEADSHCTIRYGGRPYPLLADSDQWRVRAVLALAMARIDNSPIVILDAADTLDTAYRNGLLRMCLWSQWRVLIGMTETARERLPDLEAKGWGHVYFLGQGRALALTEKAA